ncbi:MAG: hypothetical protein ACOCXA_04255 [Planctomycetota bacterium]
MLARLILTVIQPAIFLLSLIVVYLATGVGVLLFITGLTLFIIFTASGLIILLRSQVIRRVQLQGDELCMRRPWPYHPLCASRDTVRVRHLGDKLYRLEWDDHSYVFDLSLADDVAIAEWTTIQAR